MHSAPFSGRRARRRAARLLAPCLACVPLLAAPRPAHGDPVAEERAARGADPAPAEAEPALPPPPRIEIPPVTVTATRAEREVLDVPGNVTVIDREAIERSGARTVPELLRREAGLFVTNTTTNPEGATVEARGFHNGGGNGSRTLVLVDGRRVNEPEASLPDWAFLPLENVERIEVVRGPASAVWGDNAIGGVIQIVTRHPQEDGLRLHASGRTGSYDTDAGSALLEGRDGPLSASAFVEGFKTHGYRERSDFRRRTARLDLRTELGDRGIVGVQGGYTSSVRQRPGDLSSAEIEEDRRQAEPGSDDDFDHARERWLQGLVELRPWENVELRLVPYHRRRTDRTLASDPGFRFSLDRETDALGLTSQVQIDFDLLGRANRLVLGGDLLQEDVDSESAFELLGPDGSALLATPGSDAHRRRLWGAFVQDELWITDAVQLSLGLRRDRVRAEGEDEVGGTAFEVRHTAWSPRAALTWRFAEPASVYLSWARGFRFPNFDESSGFFGFAPGLEPERSTATEVGLKVRHARLTANLALYTMDVEDEILFNPFAPNPLLSTPDFVVTGLNVNVDRMRHRGLELSATLRPVDWLELFGTYTYDDVKFARDTLTGFEGHRVPLVPRHRGTAGLRLLLPWGFEASLHGRYVGSRHVANDLPNVREKLPKFASYDARIAWTRELSEGLALTAEVNGYNLTDREYTEFGGQSSFFPFPLGFFPSPERHFVAGLRLTVSR